MKKRTKITLRTKIYLTIAGLLSLTGVLYAATPLFFTTYNEPVGLAVSPFDMFGTEFNTQNLNHIDCHGVVTTIAQIPGDLGISNEKYLAIAPNQSAGATIPWNPGDIFVTEGSTIYKFSGGVFTTFANIPGC